MLEEAIILAARAHSGQLDKGGNPYILHPLRVMQSCKTEEQRIVAVLHDVVEDCDFTLTDIASQFGAKIASAVDGLTRRDGEDYSTFIGRCAQNPISRIVKLADIVDNMDVGRLGRAPTVHDARRQERYAAARAVLSQSPLPTPTGEA